MEISSGEIGKFNGDIHIMLKIKMKYVQRNSIRMLLHLRLIKRILNNFKNAGQ